MTKTNLLLKELNGVPDALLDEIIDFVQFIKQKHGICQTALFSEEALAKEWLTVAEDEAWQDL